MKLMGKCKGCGEEVYHPPLKENTKGIHDNFYVYKQGRLFHKKCLSYDGLDMNTICYLRHGTSMTQELNKRATKTRQLIGVDYDNYKRITTQDKK